MTTIYVIMETIDLGGALVHAYYDEAEAESKVKELNATHRDDKIKSLTGHCGYTQEAAKKWYGGHVQFYIEEVGIE